tara:strand:- start:677 stop:1597 length:921 start_codon:yes stop_codon:yes gene_type:complete
MEKLEWVEQEYVDLRDTTFMIPLRVETQDRMRNAITILTYLLRGFNTNVMVLENDSNPTFKENVLPVLEQSVPAFNLKNLNYMYEETEEYMFHRTRMLNDMTMKADTDIVVNYDTDILLPKNVYSQACQVIRDGTASFVYPYGMGNYQFQVQASDEQVTNFINSNFNFLAFTSKRQWDAKFGFVQFCDRKEYIRLGMEIEDFKAYGYEDDERFQRFSRLSKVYRIEDMVWHLEHERTSNSWFNNPHIESNKKLYEKLIKLKPKELLKYCQTQQYMRDRNIIAGEYEDPTEIDPDIYDAMWEETLLG